MSIISSDFLYYLKNYDIIYSYSIKALIPIYLCLNTYFIILIYIKWVKIKINKEKIKRISE